MTAEGRLNLPKLLDEFLAFWRLHGDILAVNQTYHEAACQLVFMGFLHRIVNGGGYIDREYGVGRGRIDLLIRWPYADQDGKRDQQWEAIELKARLAGRPDPLAEGLEQLDSYLDRLAWTSAPSSSSTAAQNSRRSTNASASPKRTPRPASRSPWCEPETGAGQPPSSRTPVPGTTSADT